MFNNFFSEKRTGFLFILIWRYRLRGLITFLALYLSVYGGAHLYAFVKLKNGLTLNTWVSASLAVFMSVMVLTPILMRIAERHGYELVARTMAYIGFIWMGLLFVFVSVLFFFEVYSSFLSFGRFVFNTYFLSITPTHGFVCVVSMLIACSVMAYGFFEALNIRLEHVAITTDKLPKNIDSLRIAQISDVHLGVLVGEMRLKRILDKVKTTAPHMLVSTGDLVDGQMEKQDDLAGMFREIETPHGKYAVTGNHFDLQLSGHTHNGQIFPFSLLTRLFYKTHPGLTRLREGSSAYVSRGSGTWGPPVRFLSPPEVTLIEISRRP